MLKDPGVAAVLIPLDWPDFEGVPWDGLWTLPTTTPELRAKVRDLAGTAGDSVDQEMFVVIADLLRESPAPPKLRAALYEVAGTIPGVRLLGPMTDHAGRHGVAVSRDGQTLIFDPDDGRLLEDRVASSVGTPEANAGPSGQIVTRSPAWVGTFLDQEPSESAPSPTAPSPGQQARSPRSWRRSVRLGRGRRNGGGLGQVGGTSVGRHGTCRWVGRLWGGGEFCGLFPEVLKFVQRWCT